MKIFNLENKIIEFLRKNAILIFLVVISFLAIIVRINFFNFESNDYVKCLSVWFNNLKEAGGLPGLKSYIGDYNAPYMTIMAILTYIPMKSLYLIKIVSVIFDFACAIGGSLLVFKLLKNNINKKIISIITYSILLFLPTVILNSSIWGQADIIYTTFIIFSLIFLIDEKYLLSFVFLGIAFAFKLQFIFILPLYLFIYFTKKNFSFLNFLIIPVVNFVLCLPAILYGKPIIDCFKVYINQAKSYNESLTWSFANIYNLFPNIQAFSKYGIILLFLIFGLFLLYIIYKNVKWDNEKILTVGLWCIVISTFLIPYMHERYMFVADVLSVIWFISYRKKIYVPIAINLVSWSCCQIIFTNTVLFDIKYMSLIYLLVIIFFTKHTLSLFLKDSKVNL